MTHAKTAWISLKNLRNLKLFVPDLSFFAFFSIITFIFANYIGFDIANMLKTFFLNQQIHEEMIGHFARAGLIKSAISLTAFFIVSFVIGSAALSWKYSLLKSLIQDKKPSLKKSWNEKSIYLWRVIFLRFLIYILGSGILIVGGLLVILNLWLRESISGTIPAIITTLIMITILIFYRLALLFSMPILFSKKENPLNAIIISIKTLIKKFIYTLKTWLIIFITGVGYSIIYSSVKAYIQILNTLPKGGFLFYITPTIVIIILFAISLIYKIWSELFAFRAYKNLN